MHVTQAQSSHVRGLFTTVHNSGRVPFRAKRLAGEGGWLRQRVWLRACYASGDVKGRDNDERLTNVFYLEQQRSLQLVEKRIYLKTIGVPEMRCPGCAVVWDARSYYTY